LLSTRPSRQPGHHKDARQVLSVFSYSYLLQNAPSISENNVQIALKGNLQREKVRPPENTAADVFC
jgi:hypothetical protein